MMLLPHLHTSLATLLALGGRQAAEVEVRFERPERRWVEALTRPTLVLFLFDLAESAEFRNAPAQVSRSAAGAATRLPPRRFDLRYFVAAFAADAADEQAILWHALAALLRHATLPRDAWPDPEPFPEITIPLKVGTYQDAPRTLDLWGGLDLPPRPALLLTVTAPLDLEQVSRAPLVFTRLVRSARTLPDDEAAGRGLTPPTAAARGSVDEFRDPGDNVCPAGAFLDLAGTVVSAHGVPLAGIVVRVVRQFSAGFDGRPEERNPTYAHPHRALTATSDSHGRFAVQGLTPGVVALRLERALPEDARERLKPVQLESAVQDGLLTGRPVPLLRVRVVPEADPRSAIGLPIPSLPVEIVIEE